MRKSSIQLVTQTSEPLIVVDEDDDGEYKNTEHASDSSSEGSPTHFQNQFLLSPWQAGRETRKLSLPSPQCSGITASQVRRLSEREGGGPGPRQTEFLATLCQAQAPQPGRRHSVVTICKLPAPMMGGMSGQRSRRESVAVCGPTRLLGSRRESTVGPPSTEPRGSVHNLQLDIMDDIVQSRKVRLKMWNTSNERVCEVKDEAGGVQKYTGANRRYSDFVGTTLAPIPSSSRSARRASELPPIAAASAAVEEQSRKQHRAPGIVCSNTDLISILSNLTASAMEIDQCAREEPPPQPPAQRLPAPAPRPISAATSTSATNSKVEPKGWETRRARMRTGRRSNSFDASVLHAANQSASGSSGGVATEWLTRRHQPVSAKASTGHAQLTPPPPVGVAKPTEPEGAGRKSPKVVWDGNSGSVVDAHVLGNAIEDFLRRDSQQSLTGVTTAVNNQPVTKKSPQGQATKPRGWFSSSSSATSSGRGQQSEGEEAGTSGATCDSSICATLKDLFVK